MCGPACARVPRSGMSVGWWPFRGFEERLTLKQLRANNCLLFATSELEHVSKKFLTIFLKILSGNRLLGAGVEAERAEGAASPRESATETHEDSGNAAGRAGPGGGRG